MHSFRYVGRELFCEDVALSDLVQKHGTPLYVYSQATLADHYSKLDSALAPLDHLICFAMKSNSNQSVLRTLANLGSGFDIVSGGELQRVIAAGGDPLAGEHLAERLAAVAIGARELPGDGHQANA